MMVPLPFVPPAAQDELLGSWLQRTASLYDLTAHQLLDRWLVIPSSNTNAISSVEMRVVASHAAALVGDRMRVSPHFVTAMMPAAIDWLVAGDADVAVCPRCLSSDDAAGRPRFRRRGWAQCWQVLCPEHRTPLIDMTDWRHRTLEPTRIDRPIRRNAVGRIIELRRSRGSGPSVRIGMNAVAQMQLAIRGALAGRRPHALSWGDVDPQEFLTVVRDVTTFLLNRFDPQDQGLLLCVRQLRNYQGDETLRCFERVRPRRWPAGQGGCASLVSLSTVGEVGWRRCALYWARELMHLRTARPWLPVPLTRDRGERQRVALAYQSVAGIQWICERARGWSKRYRAQRWRNWEPVCRAF